MHGCDTSRAAPGAAAQLTTRVCQRPLGSNRPCGQPLTACPAPPQPSHTFFFAAAAAEAAAAAPPSAGAEALALALAAFSALAFACEGEQQSGAAAQRSQHVRAARLLLLLRFLDRVKLLVRSCSANGLSRAHRFRERSAASDSNRSHCHTPPPAPTQQAWQPDRPRPTRPP